MSASLARVDRVTAAGRGLGAVLARLELAARPRLTDAITCSPRPGGPGANRWRALAVSGINDGRLADVVEREAAPGDDRATPTSRSARRPPQNSGAQRKAPATGDVVSGSARSIASALDAVGGGSPTSAGLAQSDTAAGAVDRRPSWRPDAVPDAAKRHRRVGNVDNSVSELSARIPSAAAPDDGSTGERRQASDAAPLERLSSRRQRADPGRVVSLPAPRPSALAELLERFDSASPIPSPLDGESSRFASPADEGSPRVGASRDSEPWRQVDRVDDRSVAHPGPKTGGLPELPLRPASGRRQVLAAGAALSSSFSAELEVPTRAIATDLDELEGAFDELLRREAEQHGLDGGLR